MFRVRIKIFFSLIYLIGLALLLPYYYGLFMVSDEYDHFIFRRPITEPLLFDAVYLGMLVILLYLTYRLLSKLLIVIDVDRITNVLKVKCLFLPILSISVEKITSWKINDVQYRNGRIRYLYVRYKFLLLRINSQIHVNHAQLEGYLQANIPRKRRN